MKKSLIISTILFAFIISSSAYAQSITREPVTISEVKSKLNNAEGWVFMDNGQWLHHQNQIYFPETAKLNLSHGETSLGKDNFIAYEIREINIQGEIHALLIKKYSKGTYKYPKLKEDWDVFNAYDFWIFEKEKLNEILPSNLVYNKPYEINIKPLYFSTGFDLHEKEINSQHIIKEVFKLMTDAKTGNKYLKLQIFPVENEGKKQLRFNYEADIISPLDEPFDPKVFDKYYYEVDFETFANFINYNQ